MPRVDCQATQVSIIMPPVNVRLWSGLVIEMKQQRIGRTILARKLLETHASVGMRGMEAMVITE